MIWTLKIFIVLTGAVVLTGSSVGCAVVCVWRHSDVCNYFLFWNFVFLRCYERLEAGRLTHHAPPSRAHTHASRDFIQFLFTTKQPFLNPIQTGLLFFAMLIQSESVMPVFFSHILCKKSHGKLLFSANSAVLWEISVCDCWCLLLGRKLLETSNPVEKTILEKGIHDCTGQSFESARVKTEREQMKVYYKQPLIWAPKVYLHRFFFYNKLYNKYNNIFFLGGLVITSLLINLLLLLVRLILKTVCVCNWAWQFIVQ